jgi:hypothetical protein
MQLQAELVHAEPGQRVVKVSAWEQGALLGSALGEGATAELAEDRAIERLRQRWGTTGAAAAARPEPVPVAAAAAPPKKRPTDAGEAEQPLLAVSNEPPQALPAQAPEPPPPAASADPEDWSDELAQVELELKRLDWGREEEAAYLGRAFNHPSRSRLVRYVDLVGYLNALQQLAPGSRPEQAATPLRRRDLLDQSDQLLGQLSWGAAQGRAFLEQHFQLSSRQQLNDQQLLQFNMLLEDQLAPRA